MSLVSRVAYCPWCWSFCWGLAVWRSLSRCQWTHSPHQSSFFLSHCWQVDVLPLLPLVARASLLARGLPSLAIAWPFFFARTLPFFQGLSPTLLLSPLLFPLVARVQPVWLFCPLVARVQPVWLPFLLSSLLARVQPLWLVSPLVARVQSVWLLFPLVARAQLVWLLGPLVARVEQRKQQQLLLLPLLFLPSWPGPLGWSPSLVAWPCWWSLPLFSSSGVGPAVWVRGRPPGHPLSQGVPLPQGLPFLQGFLALITRGCPFLQGFVPVFKGFARKKTSLT